MVSGDKKDIGRRTKVAGRRHAVDDGLRLFVVELRGRPDDGRGKLRLNDGAVWAHLDQDGKGKAVHAAAQRAELLAKQHRQHVDAPVRKVHARAAVLGLGVRVAAILYKGAHVGNVHAEKRVAVLKRQY
mgnify:CR=1 FL=1